MKRLYFFIFGAMLTMQASAQLGLGDEVPAVRVPEGYQLESTQSEYWHPLVDNGKHFIDGKSYFLYDEKGREYMRLDYDNVEYVDYGDYYISVILDEFYVSSEKRTYYTDEGYLKCEAYHEFDPFEKDWYDYYYWYTDFDETSGLPSTIYRCSGKYEEGSEDISAATSKIVIEKYHGNIPEKAKYEAAGEYRSETREFKRDFNEWGGIEKESVNFVYHLFESDYYYNNIEERFFEYDEHYNVVQVFLLMNSLSDPDDEPYMMTSKYVNEYDENGLLLSALLRPTSSGVAFDKTSYTWAKIENPASITSPASDLGRDLWYDINGCRLPNHPSKPGLYIRNGKKIVVK
ncbi:MAG: hypothetical protein J6Y97_13620 [Prevotella sp.]|nr:hypothetical protein [Prevotella sp.]